MSQYLLGVSKANVLLAQSCAHVTPAKICRQHATKREKVIISPYAERLAEGEIKVIVIYKLDRF